MSHDINCILLGVICLVGAIGIQVLLWLRIKPVCLVGDEKEYIHQGRLADPYQPGTFLRVPLMNWLSKRCSRFANQESGVRLCMVGAGMATLIVTMLAGWIVGGAIGFAVAGLVLLLMPERFVFNQHIWPEPLLALWIAGIQLALVYGGDASTLSAACGVLILLAALTRLEQLVLIPGVLLALPASGIPLTPLMCAYVIVPTGVAYLAWTIRCGSKYGVWMPDNTWCFNVQVMKSEMNHKGLRLQPIQHLVQQTNNQWQGGGRIDGVQGAPLLLARKPIAFFRDLTFRTVSLLGPDTFVSQRLMPPHGSAYPLLGRHATRLLKVWLNLAVPMLISGLFVAQSMARQWPPAFVIPAVFLFAAMCAFHSRTRFRVALLPTLAIWTAWVAPRITMTNDWEVSTVAYSVTIGLLMLTLLLFVCRNEISGAASFRLRKRSLSRGGDAECRIDSQ